MADRPKAPSKQAEVRVRKADIDLIVPPTEIVLPMAAHSYTREQYMEAVSIAIDATKKGLSVRFA
jgi:hypothetical protein